MNGLFTHNFKYKLLALACALGLYFMYGRVDVNPQTYAAVRVQVRPINVSPGLEPSSVPMVTLGLKAPKRTMTSLLNRMDNGTSDVDATVDLRARGAGPHTIPVRVAIRTPQVFLAGESPLVTVKLEPIVERRFTVDLAPRGSLPSGFRLDAAEIEPRQVTVQGPRSAVEQVARLEVRVSVRRIEMGRERDAEIHVLDSRDEPVKQVRVFPAQVRVSMRLSQVQQYKVVPVVLRTIGSVGAGRRLETASLEPMTVTLAGNSEALSAVSAVETEPVDLDGAAANMVRRTRLVLPAGVRAVSTTTVRAKLFFAAAETQNKAMEETNTEQVNP